MKNRMKEFRARYGYSQEELAALVGVSRIYITKIENDDANVSLDIAKRIAKVLKTRVDVLFF